MSKFSNTIGTVNYLQKVTKENKNSSIHTRLESTEDDNTSPTKVLISTPDIILSTAIAELRNTLLFYTLVFELCKYMLWSLKIVFCFTHKKTNYFVAYGFEFLHILI